MATRIAFFSSSFQAAFSPQGPCEQDIIITQMQPHFYTWQKRLLVDGRPELLSKKQIWEPAPESYPLRKKYADLRKNILTYATVVTALAFFGETFINKNKMVSLLRSAYSLRLIAMVSTTSAYALGMLATEIVTKILEMQSKEDLLRLEQRYQYSRFKASTSCYATIGLGILSVIGMIFCNSPKFTFLGSVYTLRTEAMYVFTAGLMLSSFLASRYWDKAQIECRERAFDLAKYVITQENLAQNIERKNYN
jgi:hypothetical protein